MRKRHLQVKVVKDDKTNPNGDQIDHDFEEKAAVVAVAFENMTDKVARAALAYVVLDTFRKVLIVKASK